MRKNVLRTALVLISAAVMVYAAHRIYQEHSEYREGADSYSVLETYIKEPQTEPIPEESKPEQDEMSENAITWPVVDFVALKSINSDCVAWIRIDGTEIDYPVVQGHDNSFYLKHLFGGEWNGAGCIFLDSRVNPDLSSSPYPGKQLRLHRSLFAEVLHTPAYIRPECRCPGKSPNPFS